MIKKLIIVLIALFAISVTAQKLPTYNVNPLQTTISGISSGGFMAVQMHIAYSAHFIGAGIIAGGPFYCAKASLINALNACMTTPLLISVTSLQTYTSELAASGQIDPILNLLNHNVSIYSGTKDTVVNTGVVKKLEQYYQKYITIQGGIQATYTIPAEHSWITSSYGSQCSYLGEPFINNCNVDVPGQILNHVYGTLNPPTTLIPGNLFTFSQTEFVPNNKNPASVSIGPTGYIYVPTSCQNNQTCSLHVALHGCEMSPSYIGNAFALHSTLNEWAESNNIIVVYPQATAALPSNMNACWDWWGYTGANYSTKSGVQMTFIYNIMQRIFGNL